MVTEKEEEAVVAESSTEPHEEDTGTNSSHNKDEGAMERRCLQEQMSKEDFPPLPKVHQDAIQSMEAAKPFSWATLLNQGSKTQGKPQLMYTTPTIVDGKPIAKLKSIAFDDEVKKCKKLLVGNFVGRKLAYKFLKDSLTFKWKPKGSFEMTTNRGMVPLAVEERVTNKTAYIPNELQYWVLEFEKDGSLGVVEPQDTVYSYVPSLSDELVQQILARFPISEYWKFCLADRWGLSLLRSGELYKIKKKIGAMEASIFMLTRGESRWLAFDREFKSLRRLPLLSIYDPCFATGDKETICAGTHLIVSGKQLEGVVVIWRFELATNKWEYGPSMINPRCLFPSASCGDFAYVAGGIGMCAPNIELKGYLKKSNSWKELGEVPMRADQSRGWGVAFKSLGDELLIIGRAVNSYSGFGMRIYDLLAFMGGDTNSVVALTEFVIPVPITCKWDPPVNGTVMVNCDGALKQDKGGIGTIIRDPGGVCLGVTCGKCEPTSIVVHELQSVTVC
ncbi:hypothetical protein GIB67_031630 [Kingdonia uniflora]|uniref:Uncharacterized protein n=1 Tax=Kingdonia uniflora TaxID=39325 RepID=A0A7J7LYF8_9MAGN|nr:hypothetical protein GIB67_031630 [Kingdonia uniflora]